MKSIWLLSDNLCMGKKSCTLSLFILSFFIAASAVASPQMLMYQGRILRNDGQALEYNGVTFEFSITNPSGSCIIYREISGANDMRNSKGIFDVPIGSGTKSFPVGPTFKLLDAFNNSTTSFSCEGGGTYSPIVGDMRLLRVQFHDGTGWKLISPDNKIGSVPFASYSLSSQKLGNNSASDFILKTDIPVCGAGTYLRHIAPLGTFLCEAVTVPGTNVTGNIAGTAAGFSGALGGDVTGNQATTQVNALKGVPVSMAGIAVGKVLKYDGTNWAPADDLSSAGSVTSLTGDVTSTGSGAVATTISNSAVTTVKINDAAVTDVKIADGAVTAAKIPDGSIADSKLQTISTAGKVSGSAITSGTIGGSTVVNTSGLISTSSGLRVYNGANYVELAPPTTLGSNVSLKLPNTAGNNGDVLKINASGQMYWDIDVGAAGVVSSVNMAMPSIFTVSGGPITTSGTLTATLNSQAANQFFASPDGSAGAPVFRAIAAADLPVVPVSRGGTGSSTALNNNRVMSSSGGLIVESAAITANRAVISDANGIPTHSAVTNTELAFLSGVTSSIQTQLNAKAGNSSWTNYSAMASDGSGNLIAVPGTVSGSLLQFSPTGPVWGSASFPTSTTANQILYSSANNVVGGLATANNAILTTNGSGVPSWSVISNDSFAQYALLAGRSGGQTLNGGTAASENLTLDSTAHATKGNILLVLSGGNVGIGKTGPATALDVSGSVRIGDGGESCSASTLGALRRVASTNGLEKCDGSSWQPMGNEVAISAGTTILMSSCPAGWTDTGVTPGGNGDAGCGPGVSCRYCQSPSASSAIPASTVMLMETCPGTWPSLGTFVATDGRAAGIGVAFMACQSPAQASLVPMGSKIIMDTCPTNWTDYGPTGPSRMTATCPSGSCRVCQTPHTSIVPTRIVAASGGTSGGVAGSVVITGGAGGSTSGPSGSVNISSGIPVDGNGGHVQVTAANGATTTNTARSGGSLIFRAGAGVADGNGGGVFIDSGNGNGAGPHGHVILNSSSSGNVGIGTLTPATKLDVSGTVSVDSSIETASALVSIGAAYTIPDSSVNVRRITLNANTTITLPAFSSPAGKVWSLTVIVVQDGTGGRTLTWAAPGGNSIKWDMGATPGPSTGASKTSIFQFIKPSDDTVWYGSMVWREN